MPPTQSQDLVPHLISLTRISKSFPTPTGPFLALKEITLRIAAGEFVAVVGKSGSGKSTLVNLLTGIDRATSGEIQVAGTAVHTLSQGGLAAWRGRNIGVVFQFFQLLPTLTVAENVMLPMDFCDTYPEAERRPRALALLNRVGIADQADKLPSALSGGQQQRAALARALANDPPILVADEPTGNLDSHTAEAVLDLFAELAGEGKTVVMVTHERDLGRFITRTVTLMDGEIVSEPLEKTARSFLFAPLGFPAVSHV
ncbi:MAG: ABC transporter ATP-binding protein [Holophagaceae bacterium]|nr:ABC transporter ATP-binding protein [Holophagaceae bacterium]